MFWFHIVLSCLHSNLVQLKVINLKPSSIPFIGLHSNLVQLKERKITMKWSGLDVYILI